MTKTRNHIDDLRAAVQLAITATTNVTSVVEAMQVTISGGPDVLGRPLAGAAGLVAGLVYGSVRGVTQLVGTSIDLALAPLASLAPLIGAHVLEAEAEAARAILNGVLGDHLQETANPLAIELALRVDGQALVIERQALREALPQAGARLLVLVHGSCMNDRQWRRAGHDHGAALARDLGYTAVYVHYNSGRHISTSGHALTALLERLVAAYPVPLDELVLLGHSMGGLVARSACHVAEAAGHAWRAKLRRLVCVGTPHHGAPFERVGNWADLLLGVSRYSAPLARLGKIRSAGITDMRHGNVLDEHWAGRDRFAHGDHRRRLQLPDGVACYAIAGTTQPATTAGPRHDGALPGDGMVPVDSALGRHERPELTLAFPEAQQWIAHGTGHLDLLARPEVYATLRRWLA